MNKCTVVIGSNFGDEGKGITTEYIASKDVGSSIVVRFNGGAQAGHTVVTESGVRVVHSSFGCGTTLGVPTYLSEYFIVNPLLFFKEADKLKKHGNFIKPYVDSKCLVTTPYDMLINQIAEKVGAANKHGSCGAGINETIHRSENQSYRITVEDLKSVEKLKKTLTEIKLNYVYDRLKELSIDDSLIPTEYQSLLESQNIFDNFIDLIQEFLSNINICSFEILNNYNNVVFEGAQGLLLDQNHRYFPHVTRSNTGIENASKILSLFNQDDFVTDIIYVTRCYMTRHGAGPFESELEDKPYSKIVDKTNVPNEYQGTLRFGLLDLDILAESISNDIKKCGLKQFNTQLMITCLDQVDDVAKYIFDKKVQSVAKEELANKIFEHITANIPSIKSGYTSYGDTKGTIKEYRRKI